MKNSDRIPAKQSMAFTRWELPEVNEGQIIQAEKTRRDIARGQAPDIDKHKVVYSKLTVAEIEDISNRIQADVQKKAYAEGLKQGQEKGFQQGLQQGQALIQTQLQSLQSVIGQLNDVLQVQDTETEQGLVGLAVSVAESILRRELSIDSSHIQAVVREAIASIQAESQTLDIYLNPEDCKLLQEQGQLEPNWRLYDDASITRGGCRLNNQFSVVEYTAEAQFQQTIQQLIDARFAELNRVAEPKHLEQDPPIDTDQ